MCVIDTECSRKAEERLDLQPGSILAVFNFVVVDLGDGEVGMGEEGGDCLEVVAGLFYEKSGS